MFQDYSIHLDFGDLRIQLNSNVVILLCVQQVKVVVGYCREFVCVRMVPYLGQRGKGRMEVHSFICGNENGLLNVCVHYMNFKSRER